MVNFMYDYFSKHVVFFSKSTFNKCKLGCKVYTVFFDIKLVELFFRLN